jgi:hypothetical protein
MVAKGREMRELINPTREVKKPKSIVKGINGKTMRFAIGEIIERLPTLKRRIGKTKSWVAIVAAINSRI